MLQPKKSVGKKPTMKKSTSPVDDYKDMKDPSTGKKGTMGGEGTNPTGPKGPGRRAPTMGSAKNGKSFPDLNKDGKITKADILKGRGVIAKNGKPVKKAFLGSLLGGAGKSMLGGIGKKMLGGMGKDMIGGLAGKALGGMMKKGGSVKKKTGMHKMPDGSMMKNSKMKMGGKMSKCKYGCN